MCGLRKVSAEGTEVRRFPAEKKDGAAFAFRGFVQHLPLISRRLLPPARLFLFADDGKISSCPSNPEHLSQPMKASICFSAFPPGAASPPPLAAAPSYKVAPKIDGDWLQSTSCLHLKSADHRFPPSLLRFQPRAAEVRRIPYTPLSTHYGSSYSGTAGQT